MTEHLIPQSPSLVLVAYSLADALSSGGSRIVWGAQGNKNTPGRRPQRQSNPARQPMPHIPAATSAASKRYTLAALLVGSRWFRLKSSSDCLGIWMTMGCRHPAKLGAHGVHFALSRRVGSGSKADSRNTHAIRPDLTQLGHW